MSLFIELRRRNVFRVAAAYTVLSWLLLQVGDVLFESLELPNTWNKGLIAVLILGLIPTVFFSWVYELTPEGIKKESEVDRSESITSHTGRKLDIAVLLMLVGVVGLYFFDPRSGEDQAPAVQATAPVVEQASEIETIAVLPFEDFSPDADQAHLARGIADTILHMLAQAEGLRVAARTSSFAYQGTSTPIAQIASELGVGAVLEGSVQRAGDRLRIIAQLIRASDQTHLWSDTFDRSSDDVFAIQDEIAQAVVTALRPGSTAESQAPVSERTDVEAYERYLRGKEALERRTAESVEFALEELRAAVELDPGFVPAWIQLGFTYMALNAVTPRTWAEIEGPAEESFRRAVELAPNDPEALSALGAFKAGSGYDNYSGRPYLEQVLSLNPNDARALRYMATLDQYDGKFDAAEEKIRRAYELDPNNAGVALQYAGVLADFGRYAQARAIAERMLVQHPDSPAGHAILVGIESTRGRYDLAIRHALEALTVNPNSYRSYHTLADLYATLDDQEEAMGWYERTPEGVQTEDYVPDALFMTVEGIDRLLESAERDLVLYPGWDHGQRRYITILFFNRQIDQAVQAAERYEEIFLTSDDRIDAAIAGTMATRVGNTELGEQLTAIARERMAELRAAGYRTRAMWAGESILAIDAEDHDTAFEALEAYLAAGGIYPRFFRLHPVFDPLREDPRFDAFMENQKSRANEQLARIEEPAP